MEIINIFASFALALLLGFVFIVYVILVKPYLKLKALKLKHKDEIEIIYHPFAGILKEYTIGAEQHDDSMYFLRKLAAEKPNLKAVGFNIGGTVGLTFVDPQLVKVVHSKHESFKKLDIHFILTYLFGDSILFQKGSNWHRQRTFLGKSFHFDGIKGRIPIIKAVTASAFSQLEKTSLGVVGICEQVTSEVMLRTFFGCDNDSFKLTTAEGNEVSVAQEIISVNQEGFELLQTSKFSLVKGLLFKKNGGNILRTQTEAKLFQRIDTIKNRVFQVIESRKAELLKDKKLLTDNLIDLYIMEIITNTVENQPSYGEILSNFMGLLFAGTDTTGNMTGIALTELAKNPDIQKRAREEIIQALGFTKGENRSEVLEKRLTFESVQKMNLIHCILKEALRLAPPAAEVVPRLTTEPVKIGEFEFEVGDHVNTHFIFSQSNPNYFAEPKRFNPDRWNDPKESSNSFASTPFSLGPRNCIGQHLAILEGKIMLIYALLHYDIKENLAAKQCLEMKFVYGMKNDDTCHFIKLI